MAGRHLLGSDHGFRRLRTLPTENGVQVEPSEEFRNKLYALLEEYGFNLSAGDMGAEIDLQDKSKTLGYWEGAIPGRWVDFR